MKNIPFCVPLLLFVSLTLLPQQAACAQKTPEELVRDFYAWYFEADSKGSELAESNDEIYQYVTKDTVAYVRRRDYGEDDIYYFTKVGAYSGAWRTVKVRVDKATELNTGTFLVPVTFILKHRDRQVVVFVRMENDAPRITKVCDVYPYL